MLEFLNECVVLGIKATIGMFLVSAIIAFLVTFVKELTREDY